ncbi:ABC transporter ATP-binding protein [Lachnospira multipara]|uniref:ABC transporter ATP-binding protein n=1 Tax=Lachnospira multipara TaxID=28051 RepID=UPI000A5C45F9|nr:ABC transporter ATP-binding protein [Lachnospira multipara]
MPNDNMSKSADIKNYSKMMGTGRGGKRNLMVEKPQDGKKTIVRLIKYFKNELNTLIVLLFAVVIACITSVYAPKLQSNAIDCIIARDFNKIAPILVILLIIYGIYSISSFIQTRLSAKLSQRIVGKMRTDLFDCIVNLPIKYLDSHSHGDIMSRMTNDVENVSTTISQSLSSLFSGVITIIATAVMMIYLCPRLAVFSMVTVILTLLVTKFLSKAMRTFYKKKQLLLGSLNGTIEEMVTGYKTVTAYNRQDQVLKDFAKTSDNLTKVGIVAEVLASSMGPIMNVINNIGFVIIAAFGGYFAINGIISVGIISAFLVYAKQFGRPIDEIANIYGQIQTAIAGAERVFAVMDESLEDKSGSQKMDEAKGVISFKNVNFSYTKEKQVLYDFNLEVKAGEKVALVGATGSGKTTVVNLLMRFYDIDSGEILVDNVNIKDIDCNNLRKNTAIVLQDTVLFADTVKNNIRYSNLEASDEEVVDACKMSRCHNMINHFKGKYDFRLAKEGQNISQGQRQLLSIARAFLAKPKILILDEATSNVDTRTEKRIQDAMVNLMKNRTSLIIAHRISTIQDADLIVVMDNGRIVEKGNHKELIKAKGKYYDLYMTQFAGVET